jgi:DNA-binding GntR family transcriptional regulator
MTGSTVLARYVGELSSRCGLILALYSRPHSSECAVNEHRALIAALAAGDTRRASALMDEHLEAVASRALIVARPAKSRELKDILSLYADNPSSHKGQNGGKRTRRQR